MDRSSFGDVLRRHLDPVLTPYGFASGQGDGPQVIFCADSDHLAAAAPALPWHEWGAGPGTCTDVVVDGDPVGSVLEVRVDGASVAALLRRVGRGDAADALEEVIGSGVEEAAPVASVALGALFRAASRRVG